MQHFAHYRLFCIAGTNPLYKLQLWGRVVMLLLRQRHRPHICFAGRLFCIYMERLKLWLFLFWLWSSWNSLFVVVLLILRQRHCSQSTHQHSERPRCHFYVTYGCDQWSCLRHNTIQDIINLKCTRTTAWTRGLHLPPLECLEPTQAVSGVLPASPCLRCPWWSWWGDVPLVLLMIIGDHEEVAAKPWWWWGGFRWSEQFWALLILGNHNVFFFTQECACICAFGSQGHIYAVCLDGSFHK